MRTSKQILASLLLVGIALALLSFDLPKSWHSSGDAADKYEMRIEKDAGQDGNNVATIKSIDNKIKGFGTLMQSCKPDKFLGKRVRMSGLMKTKDVSKWAGFWFRVDRNLGFDNMHDGKKNRSINGTNDWKRYEVVLDVPVNATNLAYGALIEGTGQIWFGSLSFEIVDSSVPTTGWDIENKIDPGNDTSYKRIERFNMKEPTNLNFVE